MRTVTWILAGAAAGASLIAINLYPQGRGAPPRAAMPEGAAFRILLGAGDRKPARWDGSIAASSGKILSLRGWRFSDDDSTDGVATWKAATRASRGRKGAAGPVVANGIVVTAAGDAGFDVKTAQGNFSFRASEIVFGEQKPFLGGRVLVDRAPVMLQLTESAEEQDYPAIAHSDDAVYVSYVEFVHSNREFETRRNFQEPKNFDFLARPAGGDQVFLLRYSKSARTWSAPMPVSPAKQDVMRTAVAVDGQKRVWVFWSANVNGNFDIHARSWSGGAWSPEMRVTTDPGTDLNPVATTDARGRVWLAWQGFRNGNLEILAAVQDGTRFAPEAVVSFSKGQRLGPRHRGGAQWRGRRFLGYLRQGRLRRLFPPPPRRRGHSHGRAPARRSKPQLRSAKFRRLRRAEPPVGRL